MKLNKLCAALVCAGCVTPGLAFATNGMNMEGYGPIATAMGGASMAYNNGTAAMMNNPATLALMPKGKQIDLAFGYLGPNIDTSYAGSSAHSLADKFYMPAFGWVTKKDKFTYGMGIYGQGGMGTEYAGSSFMSAGSGLTARSELGVGRVLFPLAMEVSPNFSVGGTFDIVWAQMDLQMPMLDSQKSAMEGLGMISFSGALAPGGVFAMPGGSVAYIDFSDNNRFTGKAKAAGYAGKIGFTYKASSKLSLGATYHSKTRLSDMVANGASLSLISGGSTLMAMDGTMTVKNFQWPSTFGLGMAYQASDKLMLAADYKRIGWRSVMQDFQMSFVDSASGNDLNITFNQNWEDQNVLMMGMSYKTTKALTLRAGINLANNPVPDYYMNALFPAIEKTHATAGFGYAFSNASTVDFALSHAFEVTSTNAMDQSVTHSQTNWQLIYSYRF